MQDGMGILYSRYGPMVYRRCRSLLKEETAATEAMKETFFLAWQRQIRYHEAASAAVFYAHATDVCARRLE